jgi:hypothetical protein
MLRFSLKQLLLGTAVAAIGLFALVAIKQYANPFDDLAFTTAAWAAADDNTRAAMADDLVRNHLAGGLSRSQVRALIGSPDRTLQSNASTRVLGAETDTYRIGSWSMQGMDDAFVYVHYDANGNVIEAEIYGY